MTRAQKLEIAYRRSVKVAQNRAHAFENARSAIRRMGALWCAWSRVDARASIIGALR